MPPVEETIEGLLFGMVRDLDLEDETPVAWPNTKFDPPAGAYLRVQHLPNVSERLFLKGSAPHLRQGILQLTVVTALGAGATAATALAGAIAAQFPADRSEYADGVRLRVQKAPDLAQPIADGAAWLVPVSIRYECLA